MRVAIYLRISQDRTGLGHGVDRQREACEKHCEARGWGVVATYVDNDVSAYTGKVRKDFARLLVDLDARRFDVLVAWDQDRLYRSLRDFNALLEVLQKNKVLMSTVNNGDTDLSSHTGAMVAGFMAQINQYESAHKSERIRLQRAKVASNGGWSGGPRVYGYTQDMTATIPDEAKIIREIADRVLVEEPLKRVAADLNDRNVPTARGGIWHATTIRAMIVSARLSGQREHSPGEKGRGFGQIVAQGTWPAILTPAETQELRQMLSDPRRKTTHAGQRLLSGGLVKCGRCGGPLNSRTASDGSGWRYSCIKRASSTLTRCGGLSVVGRYVDEAVTEQVLSSLDVSAIRQARTVPASSASSELDELMSRQNELALDYAAGLVSREAYATARQRLASALYALDRDRKASRLPRLDLPKTNKALREAWPSYAHDRQRSIIAAVIDHALVRPAAVRGQSWFDPDRVEIIWNA